MRRSIQLVMLWAAVGCRVAPSPVPQRPSRPHVVARAVLPAETFSEGPPTGARVPGGPFPSPVVQGFSSLIAEPDGGLLGLIDNGFGGPENSDDALLRVYRLQVAADGQLAAQLAFTLSAGDIDPGFSLIRDQTPERWLTGADFDPESFQRAPDGTFWVGEELGPSLLHVGADGRLLEPPYLVPDLRSPSWPGYEEAAGLHVLQALRFDAEAHGARAPVLSPWHLLLKDDDPATGAPSRAASDGGTAAVSSELFEVSVLHRAGFQVVPWTVNEPERIAAVLRLGVDGLISDRPDLVLAALDGGARLDVQGHRGARGLRPENTLPAMEAALDLGVTTLETDVHLTADGVPVLWHDSSFDADKCRAKTLRLPARITGVSAAQVRREVVCDRLQPKFPAQRNERALSPVASAFSKAKALADPYTPATLDSLFEFVEAYAAHYSTGPGRSHPDAAHRAAIARAVRFNLETKVNPRPSSAAVSGPAEPLTRAIAESVAAHGLQRRATLQSFDWATLRLAFRQWPWLQTVALVADLPEASGGDGLNLEPLADGGTPMLGGLRWPWRSTFAGLPPRVQRSGGFEALGLSPDGATLYAVLEKPLAGDAEHRVLMLTFDVQERRFTGKRRWLPLHPRAVAVSELQLVGPSRALMLERDDSAGDPAGYKHVIQLDWSDAGVERRDLVDLNALEGLDGGPFTFPFWTVEVLTVLDGGRLVVMNDNNYPFGTGRQPDAGVREASELIVIEPVPPPGAGRHD